MEGNIIQLKEYHLNKGASKDHTPVFPMTKASAIEGMSELLRDLNINGVSPTNDISSVINPEKGKIYYEESTDKYYVYSGDKSSFVELGAGASVDPSDMMPTITQEASTQSGGDNIITFTFPNGETTQITIKNGAQGNSGVASADGVIVVNNLTEGGTSVTEDGVTKVKVLSAEMGKELAQQSIIESGTFAKAYLKAVDVNVPFPWVLKDTDGNGNAITKMIWHIGNREFVDAAGADVNWYTDGMTVITSAACTLWCNDSQANSSVKIPLVKGLNRIPFSQLHPEGSTVAEGTIRQCGFYTDSTITTVSTEVLYVNFGGLKMQFRPIVYDSSAMSKIKGIENFIANGGMSDWNSFINRCPNLEYVNNMSGTISYYAYGNQIFQCNMPASGGYTKITKLDLSKLSAPVFNINGLPNLTYLDISGVNPGNHTELQYNKGLLSDLPRLSTLVINNFDTSNYTLYSGKTLISSISGSAPNGLTLVCTKATPPANKEGADGDVIVELLDKATTILVPPGSEQTYKADTVWSEYSSKISEYAQGEY